MGSGLVSLYVETEASVRNFLIVLVASTVASIGLWNFGMAHKIWPAHPLLATIFVAAMCGIAVQLLLPHGTHDSRRA
jgi:hypothetical protein